MRPFSFSFAPHAGLRRFRFDPFAPQTTENLDLRFTAHSGQFAYRLHFSVALLALAGVADWGHLAMVGPKPVGTVKILPRKTTVQWP